MLLKSVLSHYLTKRRAVESCASNSSSATGEVNGECGHGLGNWVRDLSVMCTKMIRVTFCNHVKEKVSHGLASCFNVMLLRSGFIKNVCVCVCVCVFGMGRCMHKSVMGQGREWSSSPMKVK